MKAALGSLAALVLACCALFETAPQSYAGTPKETEEKLISHNEVWVRLEGSKTPQRIGYLKKFSMQLPGEWIKRIFHRFYDDERINIGMLDEKGELYRYVGRDYQLVGTHFTMEMALKEIYEQPLTSNVYIAGVNPYRD